MCVQQKRASYKVHEPSGLLLQHEQLGIAGCFDQLLLIVSPNWLIQMNEEVMIITNDNFCWSLYHCHNL